jgi:hypothetical protein
MRIARWRRRGWTTLAVIDAGSADEAETRLAEADELEDEVGQDRAPITPSSAAYAGVAAPSPGLLLNPGR